LVRVPPTVAFRAFSEDIDQWWRRGLPYRVAGTRQGIIHIEGSVGGRLFESFETPKGPQVYVTGRVTAWDPPSRIVFEWRSPRFAPDEKTLVEVTFEKAASGTLVTVTHSGWSAIRPDHPARHGQEPRGFLRTMGLWGGDLMPSFRENVE